MPQRRAATPSLWDTVRVFVSSTFRDMHSERDHLVRVVFPELRESLLAHRIHFVDVDLRWGVPRDMAPDARAVAACTAQVDRCRPYFIAILGQRYGSVAVPARRAGDAPSAGRAGVSITEIEIRHALSPPARSALATRAFVYLRSPAYLADVPPAARGIYLDEAGGLTDDAMARKLEALKEFLRGQSGLASLFDGYPCAWAPDSRDPIADSRGRIGGLRQFGERVLDDLRRQILADLRPGSSDAVTPAGAARIRALAPAAEREEDLQAQFVAARTFGYIPLADVERRIQDAVAGRPGCPIALVGPSGSGKSTQLARWVAGMQGSQDLLVLASFVGASPASADLGAVLDRFAGRLEAELDKPAAPGAQREPDRLGRLLHAAAERRPVALVLDGLDRLHAAGGDATLEWLPRTWPPGLVVLVSLDPSAARAPAWLAELDGRDAVRLPLGPLAPAHRARIARETAALMGKLLERAQRRRLLGMPASGNVLFLRVALEEMRTLASPTAVDRFIDSLPSGDDATTALFAQVLDRVEKEFGTAVVRSVATCLTAAPDGLRESELRTIVAQFGTPGGDGDLFPVLRRLRPYLGVRGDRVAIGHATLLRAIELHRLDQPGAREVAHHQLALVFGASPDARRRWIDHPRHLLASGQKGRVRDWLRSGTALVAAVAVDARAIRAVVAEWQRRSRERLAALHSEVLQRPSAHPRALVAALAGILGPLGERAVASCLWEELSRHGREAGDPGLAAASLHELGHLRRRMGDPDEALALHREEERIAAEEGDERVRALALGAQANALEDLGRHDESEAAYAEAASIQERLGEMTSLAVSWTNLGSVAYRRGRWPRALDLYRAAERLLVAERDVETLATVLFNQALVYRRTGDLARALALLDRADALDTGTARAHGLQRNARLRAEVLAAQGDFKGAVSVSGEQVAAVRAMEDPVETAFALITRAETLRSAGEYAQALRVLDEAWSHSLEAELPWMQAEILAARAGVYALAGDAAAAGAALAELERMAAGGEAH